ncbi:heat-shock protein Hsp20 [Enterococcus sp. JM4C]|uniref:Hsp20/alpha crystallin family protein n=1 Tax=Candidatus Enterococcus huntleyi TaxID=1857217 RepID=UPI00137AA73C|nr:Hsp20/alpha crystallin family protein [Enterococcus sp. JM4C]KAF1297519.1 heat-shock protein Hsp20 [Enterococcus sp. JM4C]
MANVPSIRDMFPDFSDVFSPNFSDFLGVASAPKVDLKESDKEYELTADMPGCDKEDTVVEYANDTLTISAKHENKVEEKEDEKNYLRKERSVVSYNRSFYMPNVDEDKITGKFEKGVLHLTLPKSENHKKDAKRIELK